MCCVELAGHPNGALHLMRHMMRVGGDPRQWFAEFSREFHLSKTDRVWHELSALVEAMALMGQHDCLNIPSFASAERIVRRIDSIIESYGTGSGGVPNWKLANQYNNESTMLDAIAPGLRQSCMLGSATSRRSIRSQRPRGRMGISQQFSQQRLGRVKERERGRRVERRVRQRGGWPPRLTHESERGGWQSGPRPVFDPCWAGRHGSLPGPQAASSF